MTLKCGCLWRRPTQFEWLSLFIVSMIHCLIFNILDYCRV